jgi:septum formation protein
VRATGVDELTAGEPAAVALENARRKAQAAAMAVPPASTVLGVDTIVATDAGIWGKPADAEAAHTTLTHLSGRTHEVVSGAALIGPDSTLRTTTAVTAVTFRKLPDALLARYIAGEEWRERAGGYAIQGTGALFVARIEGDYLNVVGLPVAALYELAPELFF